MFNISQIIIDKMDTVIFHTNSVGMKYNVLVQHRDDTTLMDSFYASYFVRTK